MNIIMYIASLTCFLWRNLPMFPHYCTMKTRLTCLYINNMSHLSNNPKRITLENGRGYVKIRGPPLNKRVWLKFEDFEKLTIYDKKR